MTPTEFTTQVCQEYFDLEVWLQGQGIPPGNKYLERIPLLRRVQELLRRIAAKEPAE